MTTLKKMYADTPIGTRILLGFSLFVVIMAVVGLKTELSMRTISKDKAEMVEANSILDLAIDFEEEFLAMKLAISEYVAKNTPERFENAKIRYDAFIASLEHKKQNVTAPSVLEVISAIEGHTTYMWNDFSTLAETRDERRQLERSVLLDEGDTVQAALAKAAANAYSAGALSTYSALTQTNRLILNGLVSMSRYSDTLETKYEKQAAQVFRDAAEIFAGVPVSAVENHDAIARYIDQAPAAMDRVVEIVQLNAQQAVTVLEDDGKKIADDISVLRNEAKAESDYASKELEQNITDIRTVMGLSALGAIVVTILLGLFLGRSLSRPIVSMAGSMRDIAAGNLDQEVQGIGQKSEIGTMAQALEDFRQQSLENRALREEQEQRDILTRRRQNEIDRLIQMFGKAITGVLSDLSENATTMNGTAGRLKTKSEDDSQSAMSVTASAEETSASVSTVASATEELAASTSEIGQQVTHAANTTQEATNKAQQSAEQMTQLKAAADQISDILNTITEIAEQTNLLALNATIESARAGEAGKGFAVVANEVKALAQQTGKATENISAQIEHMQSVTEAAVSSIETIVTVVSDLNEMFATISSAVTEQDSVTKEITRSLDDVSQSTKDVSARISGIYDSLQNTLSEADGVTTISEDVTGKTMVMSEEVQNFLASINDSEKRAKFAIRQVSLSVKIDDTPLTATQISPAGIQLNAPLEETTKPVHIYITDFDRDCICRFCENNETGAYLQFPLNAEHIDAMDALLIEHIDSTASSDHSETINALKQVAQKVA